MKRLRIGTRGSALALWQSRHVAGLLGRTLPGIEIELVEITSLGDRVTDVPLSHVEGTGFFTASIEHALIAGEVDIAVHSLKDLPVDSTPGLVVAAVPPRGPVEDTLCARDGRTLATLPAHARVGTCSARRTAQVRMLRPDLELVPLRGNVPTRLRKLAENQGVDAIVLAAAGLTRLNLDLSGFVVVELPPEWWVPAPGQGALAAQCRVDDPEIQSQVATLADAACVNATRWEREFLRVIEGGCSTPFGCHVTGTRAYLGIATERGWAAGTIELPEKPLSQQDGQRDSFIRAAVAGCKPVEPSETAVGALGRTLHAR